MAVPLRIAFATDTAAARRATQELAASVTTSMVSIAQSASLGVRAVNALPTAIRLAAVGTAGLVGLQLAFRGIGAAVEAAKEQIAEFTKIGDEARQAGVGTTFLQVWQAQAKALKVETDDLTRALNAARDAATMRQGAGGDPATSPILSRLREQAEAGNIGAGDVARFAGAADLEAQARAVLDLVQRLRDEGKELAAMDLAGRFFGADFERLLRSGTDAVGRMREALAAMDRGEAKIVSPEQVARANALTERLNAAQQVISTGLKPLYDDLARLGVNHHQGWVGIVEKIAAGVTWAGQLYTALREIPGVLEQAGNASIFTKINQFFDRNGLSSLPAAGQWVEPKTATAEDVLRRRLQDPAARMAAQRASDDMMAGVRPDATRSIPAPAPRAQSSAGSDVERLDAVERFIQSLEKQNELLRTEAELIDATKEKREGELAVVRAKAAAQLEGRNLTEEEIQKVRQLGEEYGRAGEKLEQLRKKKQEAAETASYFGDMISDALADIIVDGRDAGEVMEQLRKSILRAMIQGAITGGGPLGGLFGGGGSGGAPGGLMGLLSSLAPGRASGGPVYAGQPYVVGERRPELFVPESNGTIVPRVPAIGAPAIGAPSIPPAVTVSSPITVVNNAPGIDVQPQRQTGGGMQITIEEMAEAMEARLSGRFMNGQGGLAGAMGGAPRLRG